MVIKHRRCGAASPRPNAHGKIAGHPQEADETGSHQLVQQRLGVSQDRRVETFGEPTVDRGEKIVGLLPFALIETAGRNEDVVAKIEQARKG
jgi:hypothetical protein